MTDNFFNAISLSLGAENGGFQLTQVPVAPLSLNLRKIIFDPITLFTNQ
jgi:hypothetical protein